MERGERQEMKRFVTFEGIDGSGKTTYALNLIKDLEEQKVETKYLHFNSTITSKLIKYMYNHKKDKERNTNSSNSIIKKQKSTSLIKSNLYLFLLILDDIFFYLYNYKSFHNQNVILICDRYFYDTLAKNLAMNSKSKFLQKIYYIAFPNPDIAFLIDISAEAAYIRKREEALTRLAIQRNCYIEIYRTLPYRKMKIDSSQILKVASKNIFNCIYEIISK